jgi:integrase
MSKLEKVKYLSLISLAWYCWMRVEEVVQLRMEDILELDIELQTEDSALQGRTYSVITIPKRKTDQLGQGTHDNVSEEPFLMANAKLVEWIKIR